MNKLESYFKSESERNAVKAYIDRQIYCVCNELQELYAKNNECWVDELVNLYEPIETCKQEYFDYVKENISEDLRDLIDAMKEWNENDGGEDYSPYDYYYNQYIDHLKEESEEQEVFQWYLVSDWLANKLEAIGQPILRTDSNILWGRTCYGQSLELDGTLQEVYRLTQQGE